MQLTFLSIGIFFGCAMKRYKNSSSAAVSLILGTYFISVISGLDQSLEFLKYFTPFKYFDAGFMLRELRLDPFFVALSLVIIALSMVGAYLAYNRRDLYI
jgi:ABC-2 type transport system permease protein